MNKKVLSLGVMLSLATTGVMAADSVTTSVNNGDQLTKYQKEAIQLTQKQLAEKMNCSPQYISKVLRGRENLSLETLTKIENALEISIIKEEPMAV